MSEVADARPDSVGLRDKYVVEVEVVNTRDHSRSERITFSWLSLSLHQRLKLERSPQSWPPQFNDSIYA